MMVRYALEDQARDNDFTGGNVTRPWRPPNTNKIHSAIAKNTTVFDTSKVNELTVLFQYFENNILAETPGTPGHQHARLHRRRERQHAAADDPAPLADPRRLLVPQAGLGRRPQLQGRRRAAEVALRRLLHPDALRLLHLRRPDPGREQRERLRRTRSPTRSPARPAPTKRDDNWTYVAGYVQDDWKPTPRLTLNLGLRWEMQTGPLLQHVPERRQGRARGRRLQRRARARQEQLRAPHRLRLRRARATRASSSAAATARYYDEIFQNITLYEGWSDPGRRSNFVSASPTPWTPASSRRIASRSATASSTRPSRASRCGSPLPPWSSRRRTTQRRLLGRAEHAALAFDIDYVCTRSASDEVHRWRDQHAAEREHATSRRPGVFPPQYAAVHRRGQPRPFAASTASTSTGKYAAPPKLYGITSYAWIEGEEPRRTTSAASRRTSRTPTTRSTTARRRTTSGTAFTAGARLTSLPLGLQLSSGVQANTGKPLQRARRPRRIAQRRPRDRPGHGPAVRPQLVPRGAELLQLGRPRFSKMLRFGGSKYLEVMFEMFNITNHVNFTGSRIRVRQHVHLGEFRPADADRPQQPAAGASSACASSSVSAASASARRRPRGHSPLAPSLICGLQRPSDASRARAARFERPARRSSSATSRGTRRRPRPGGRLCSSTRARLKRASSCGRLDRQGAPQDGLGAWSRSPWPAARRDRSSPAQSRPGLQDRLELARRLVRRPASARTFARSSRSIGFAGSVRDRFRSSAMAASCCRATARTPARRTRASVNCGSIASAASASLNARSCCQAGCGRSPSTGARTRSSAPAPGSAGTAAIARLYPPCPCTRCPARAWRRRSSDPRAAPSCRTGSASAKRRSRTALFARRSRLNTRDHVLRIGERLAGRGAAAAPRPRRCSRARRASPASRDRASAPFIGRAAWPASCSSARRIAAARLGFARS